jgi:hypothetical protein
LWRLIGFPSRIRACSSEAVAFLDQLPVGWYLFQKGSAQAVVLDPGRPLLQEAAGGAQDLCGAGVVVHLQDPVAGPVDAERFVGAVKGVGPEVLEDLIDVDPGLRWLSAGQGQAGQPGQGFHRRVEKARLAVPVQGLVVGSTRPGPVSQACQGVAQDEGRIPLTEVVTRRSILQRLLSVIAGRLVVAFGMADQIQRSQPLALSTTLGTLACYSCVGGVLELTQS